MPKNRIEIVLFIERYVFSSKCSGGDYSDYYVGITNDVDRRLKEHNASIDFCHVWCEANDTTEARAAEQALINKGMDGGEGGGDKRSFFVYCYQITDYTIQ